jgi:hypothetical protein
MLPLFVIISLSFSFVFLLIFIFIFSLLTRKITWMCSCLFSSNHSRSSYRSPYMELRVIHSPPSYGWPYIKVRVILYYS